MRLLSTIVVSLLAGLGASRATERRATPNKPIVAHYMIGGITDAHTRQDIVDAQSLGLDGFAMNFDQFAYWSEGTVDSLFNHADELGFKLFFSFDHAAGHLHSPADYTDYFNKYKGRPSYFKGLKNKPLVSTFGAEDITNDQWNTFRKAVGDVLIVPGFYKIYNPSTTFFSGQYSSLDGVFNWNSWPASSDGKVIVSSAVDNTFNTAAHSSSRVFMMGMSPVQFKHYDQNNNWYRRGEQNLEYRFGQALALQPDIIQLQTWNDAGEGHYMGNVWPETLTTAPQIAALTKNFDHTGYWQILKSFIKQWHAGDTTTANMYPTNGKRIQGTFWHHTLTVGADCSSDPLVKSQDITNDAADAVSGVVLVASGNKGLVAVVNVNGALLNTLNLNEGYNSFKFLGMGTGKVQLEVWDGSTMIGGGYATLPVVNKADLCNYNFQVVGFPG
jgi:glucan endo-1,3-alpha-glucosidase